MDKRLWNSPEEKTAKKDTKLERKGEKCSSFLSNCNIERWIYYPENLTDFSFFFFLPEVPGTQSYHYDQNTWTVQQLPNLTLKVGGKKESAPVFISVLHLAQLVLM